MRFDDTSWPNAVELTVAQAWYIAETINAGTFPWVLAITIPYTDSREHEEFCAQQQHELTQLGVISQQGIIHPAVANWIRVVCFPDRWLDLRYINLSNTDTEPAMLRGIIARCDRHPDTRNPMTIVALRSAQLITFTSMVVDNARSLVPILNVGLQGRPAAKFPEFSLPAKIGAHADERLRRGDALSDVLQYLGLASTDCQVIEAVFSGPRSYVEVVAGCSLHGHHKTSEVGMSIIDALPGRILVAPTKAFDGEWISTFCPGTDTAIATAVQQLTNTLDDDHWFSHSQTSQSFTFSSTS